MSSVGGRQGGLHKIPKRKKMTGCKEREIRSSLLIIDLNKGQLYESGKEEGKTFHILQVFGTNDDFWDRVREQ